jgi:predicted AlkP superfamily pyrophosphatase or phosphodiesterase
MLTLKKMLLLLTLLVLIACETKEKPRLVVVIALDHFAYFTYDHYRPTFTQGLKWLDDHGNRFNNAHHEHGYCATGPGHFVLGSGLHPGPAGVLGNYWYDRSTGKDVYCVEDPDASELDIFAQKVSYDKVNGTTYGDWLKAVSPQSQVYGVATKDRASIMMSGKNPDLSTWYNYRGAFTTTDYYTDTIPAWLHDFNEEFNALGYRDSVWTNTVDPALLAEYTHGDSFYGETDKFETATYSPVFPIGFEADWDDEKVYGELPGRPWMDRITLDLATTLVRKSALGQDDSPDILNIGLSTMDWLAHYYGPFSHEVMDHLHRVDGYLMNFIEFLDQEVGLEHVVFVLSSDHGGLPLPEHWTHVMKKSGGRVDEEFYLATRAKAYAQLDSLYGTHEYILRKGSSYFYDFEMMDSLDVNQALVDSILQTYMESVDGVYRLYTKTELLSATPEDRLAYRLRNFMNPQLSPDLYTLLEEGWLFRTPYGTSHSTPYDYDSHVPLIFSSINLKSVALMDSVATIDMAPTLADLLGVKPLNRIDGKSLKPLLMFK